MGTIYLIGRHPYARLERALGVALYADETTQRGALRGRLKRLLTLGIPAPDPEQRARRQYSLEEAHQLLAVLLMEDAGLDPLVAAPALKKLWANNMRKLAENAAAAKDSIMIVMTLCTVTGPWRTGDPNAALLYVYLTPRRKERVLQRYRQQGRSEAESLLLADEIVRAADDLREEDGWLAVRNFSVKAKKLEAVLNEEI